MQNFDLLFVVTCTSKLYIHDLLYSIAKNNKSLSLKVVLLLQNNIYLDVDEYKTMHTDIALLYSEKRLSLSHARNVAIKFIAHRDIVFKYIMFPDDDSTFDSSFFSCFEKYAQGDFLIDVYCAGTHELYKPIKYSNFAILKCQDYEAAMSVNMCITYKTFKGVGLFDECLGVGAKYGAGEDSDYFIRCCLYNKQGFIYVKSLWNYHPRASEKYKVMTYLQLKQRYKTYGEGVIYMLYKHQMIPAIYLCIIKGLMGGIIALFHGDVKLFKVRLYAFIIRWRTYNYLRK